MQGCGEPSARLPPLWGTPMARRQPSARDRHPTREARARPAHARQSTANDQAWPNAAEQPGCPASRLPSGQANGEVSPAGSNMLGSD